MTNDPANNATATAPDMPSIPSMQPDRQPDRTLISKFALGVLVGVAGTYIAMTMLSAMRPTAPQSVDMQAVREAAKQGVAEAIQEDRLSPIDTSEPTPLAVASVAEPAVSVAVIGPQNIATRANSTLGNATAPVAIIEYSDFQCPFCNRFNQQVYPKLIEQYVKTGKVKFSYKHFAFLGDESHWAAQAAECAADQKRFWDYHDLLFDRQNGENGGAFAKDKLIGFAQELKLDTAAFTTCLNGDKTADRVAVDSSEGQRLGVRGTPAFLINGKMLVGAQPFEAFQSAIEAALKSK